MKKLGLEEKWGLLSMNGRMEVSLHTRIGTQESQTMRAASICIPVITMNGMITAVQIQITMFVKSAMIFEESQ